MTSGPAVCKAVILVLTAMLACAVLSAGAPRVRARDPLPPGRQTPTYTKDIAPLFSQACISCHRPGRVGPFSLHTYQDVRKRARQIAQVTRSGYMPPWLPDREGPRFRGERRLSRPQTETIRRWADQGAREGDSRALPPSTDSAVGWRLGPPDLIVKMPRAYTLPAETSQLYRCFVLPVSIARDQWVRAIDFRPGDPRVVRYASLFTDAKGTARRLEAQSGTVGYSAFEAGLGPHADRLAEWAPGAAPLRLPDGVAYLLKRGADLVLLLRFHPDGQAEQEQCQIGLYFARQPPRSVPVALPLGLREIYLPAGEKAVVTDTFLLPVPCTAIGIMAHAHPLCRTINASAALPDGTARLLLGITDYDANWVEPYRYAAPLKLPAGTRLSLRLSYDNSASNPRAFGSPPMYAMSGLEYLEEMARVQVLLIPERLEDREQLTHALETRGSGPRLERTLPQKRD